MKSVQTNPDAFFLLISDQSGLPCALWEQGRVEDTLRIFPEAEKTQHPLLSDPALAPVLEASCKADTPVIYLENEYVFWGLLRTENMSAAIGPVSRNTVSADYEVLYAGLHRMERPMYLPKADFQHVQKNLALLFCHLTGLFVSYKNIPLLQRNSDALGWQLEADLEQYQLEQSENERTHTDAAGFEERLFSIVRSGDRDALDDLIHGEFPDMGQVGTIAEHERKQIEYLCVSLITLLTRAAIEGGMRTEAAHELGDIYLKHLAQATLSGTSFTTLGMRSMRDFTEQVHLSQERRRNLSHVEKCKDYIEKNIRKEIHVSEIAPALGISRTHLSHLFAASESITIQQYIQREKCRHAANMLKYSDLPVAQISEYFNFSSQSYFAACFRQWFGTTPRDYRQQNTHS